MKKRGNLQEFFFSVINYTFLFRKNFHSSINNINDKNRYYFRIYIKDFSAFYSTVNNNSSCINNIRVTNKYLTKKRYIQDINHNIFCRTNENNYSIVADVLIKDKTNENVKVNNNEDIKIDIKEEKKKKKEIKAKKKKLIKEGEKINKKVKKEVKKNLPFVENKTMIPLKEKTNNVNIILDEKNNKKKKKKKNNINVITDIKEDTQDDKKKDITISDEISGVTINSSDMKENVNNNINRNEEDLTINNDNKVVCSDILLNKEQISNNITKEKKKEKMKKKKESKTQKNNVLKKNENEICVNRNENCVDTNNVLNNHENEIINNNFNKEEYFKEFEQIGIKNNIIIKKINTIEDINKFVNKYENSLGYCNIYAYNNLLYEIYDKFSNSDIKKVKKLIKNYNKLTKKNFQKKIKFFETFYEICPTKYNDVLTCLFIQSVDILKAEDISNTFYFDNILNINKEENENEQENEHENENIDVATECITTSEKVNYDYYNYDYEITEEEEKRKIHNINYRKNEGYINNKIVYDIDVKFTNKNERNHINENNFIIVYDLPILSYDLLTKELKETFSFCGKIKAIEFFNDRLKTVDMNMINNENECKDVGTVNGSKNSCKSKNRDSNNGRKKGNQKGKEIKFDNNDKSNDNNNDDNNNNDNNNNDNNKNNDNNNNNKQKLDNICNYNIYNKNQQTANINKNNENIKKKDPQKIKKIVNPNQSTQLYGIIEFYDSKSADMATSDFLRIFGIFCYNKLIYVDKCVNKNIMIITHLPFHLNIYNILYLLLNASLYNFDISHIKEEEKLNSKKYDMRKNIEGIINNMCSNEENIINDKNKFISNENLEIINNKILLKGNKKKEGEQNYIYNNGGSLENEFDSFHQEKKELNLINTETEKDNNIINNIMSNNKTCENETNNMCSFVLRNSNIKIENNDSHFKEIYKNSTDIYNYIYEISKINFKHFEEKINRHLQTNISSNNKNNNNKNYESFVDFYQNKNKKMITRKVHINNNGRTLILHFDNFTNLFECLKKFKYIFKNKNYMIFSLNLKRCIFFNGQIKDHVHIQNERRKIGINMNQ
ncbi:conserved Plasmodium protein, unknown function [Plasmodium sp. gorilla clade G2]|uniref:conserved Plasmodium protein, unknown function n=1 Tax=Plasmodium sp. gorilla clade G2 TaxID=880535 RepID=UPI000D210A2F|nr:conserved Plasmodium protein, unknown function [Plasmodium sp. gorilla clade G2]SOV13807.1 conserved Plasmodium protein, unknown function [Plasmodium sp. gorilla clade G2]